ncbi:MAG: hypothetical protein WKG00_29005 [Polyangiaceae bacterium]
MARVASSLAPRLCALSAALIALAASASALQGTNPPWMLLAVASAFAVAGAVCSIPLRSFPAYGLGMVGLMLGVGAAWIMAPELSRAVGILLAAVGALSLAAAVWPWSAAGAVRDPEPISVTPGSSRP